MSVLPYTKDSYELLHQGAIALAEIECNGMAVDTSYIHKATLRANKKIEEKRAELETTDVMKEWRKAYRRKTNINSTDQLAHVLFNVMGMPKPANTTQGGKVATDEETLTDYDNSFVNDYLELKKLSKAVNTNLKGVLREVVNGRVHCFFNLGSTVSYRSSSDSFNFQNLPIRDPVIGKLIRRIFIPSPGRQIVEIDFSGAEVIVAACYHKDPVMIEYITTDGKDMHRDTAMDLFGLPEAEVTKEIRFIAKSFFVFAEFYGDWYKQLSPKLWKAMKFPSELCTTSGVPLRQHLANIGIKELGECDPSKTPRDGTFEQRVQKTEKVFWFDRFKIYSQWKKEWIELYRSRGWMETFTGFICQGYIEKNQIINYPIQGSSFHCLLWSLVRLVRIELVKRNMKTLIVGQIHDSIVADVVPEELDDYLDICQKVMTVKLSRRWPWLIIPMKVEVEVAPVGASWAEKKKHKM